MPDSIMQCLNYGWSKSKMTKVVYEKGMTVQRAMSFLILQR